jgi:hypothetical protein
MRKTICRTITATTIESANVTFEKGIPTVTPNDVIVVNGNIPEKKALKEVQKTYGANAQITALTQANDIYEISVEDFIKYAKKVDMPSPEQQIEGAAK